MNYYNYFWNKQMWSVKFCWLFFSNGYLINLKKISRVFLALWLSKNSMIFQGMKLNTTQKAHKIWVSFKGSWNPLKEKYQRILEKPNLALIMKKLGVSTINIVKDIQECAWQGPFRTLILLIIFFWSMLQNKGQKIELIFMAFEFWWRLQRKNNVNICRSIKIPSFWWIGHIADVDLTIFYYISNNESGAGD